MHKHRCRYPIGPFFVIGLMLVALLSLLSPKPAEAATAGTTIYRCVMADGSTAFSDRRCPNALSTSVWKAPVIPQGLRRSTVTSAPPASTQAGRGDPFLNCMARGGTFHPAARLCRVPAGVSLDDKAR